MRGSHTSSEIVFLANDILAYRLNGFYVRRVARECSHVSHSGIHISGSYGMSHGFLLVNDGLQTLGVDIMSIGLSAIVEHILSLVEIFLFSRDEIKTAECHFCNLMTRHYMSLTIVRTNLTQHAVGIAFGNVEEVGFSCGLIMRTGGIHHVPEVVQLVAQHLFLHPSALARPLMGLCGIDCPCSVEISVRLLCRSDYGYHTVDIRLEFLVGIVLQHIACTFYGFINISVVEAEPHECGHVIVLGMQFCMLRMRQGVCRLGEIAVSVLFPLPL